VRLEDTPGVRVFDWNEHRQRNGSSSRVFPLGAKDDTERPCWLQFKYEPGWVAPVHAHSGWTCTVIIEGSWFAAGVEYFPGQMVMVAPNVQYGPFKTGPNGVTAFELFENQAALPPIWDESDPDVQAVKDRLGDTLGSMWNNNIAD
jgi:hypothetical protein